MSEAAGGYPSPWEPEIGVLAEGRQPKAFSKRAEQSLSLFPWKWGRQRRRWTPNCLGFRYLSQISWGPRVQFLSYHMEVHVQTSCFSEEGSRYTWYLAAGGAGLPPPVWSRGGELEWTPGRQPPKGREEGPTAGASQGQMWFVWSSGMSICVLLVNAEILT